MVKNRQNLTNVIKVWPQIIKKKRINEPYLSAILIFYFEKYYYSQIAKSSEIGMATKFSLATASFCGISVQTQFLLEQLNL